MSVFNVSSVLIFEAFLKIAVFMAAYIPLRIFVGGYHAKTSLRCYIFSVIMLIIVSIGMKYLSMAEWVYYAVLLAMALVMFVLSPVEDRNKLWWVAVWNKFCSIKAPLYKKGKVKK